MTTGRLGFGGMMSSMVVVVLAGLPAGCDSEGEGEGERPQVGRSAAVVEDGGSADGARSEESAAPPELADAEPRVRAAINEAWEAVQGDPASAFAWGQYGMVLDAHYLFRDAVKAYRRALTLDPTEFTWAYFLGCVLIEADAPKDEIARVLDLAATLEPRYAPMHCRWGDYYARLGDFEKAAEAYKAALAADPQMGAAQRGLGKSLSEMGKNVEALGWLEQAVVSMPDDLVSHTALIAVLRDLGDRSSAEKLAARMDGMQPGGVPDDPIRDEVAKRAVSSSASAERAAGLMAAGRYDEAIGAWRIVAEARPDDASVQFGLGRASLYAGELQQAALHLNNAIRLQPDMVEALIDLGQLMMVRREAAPAVEYLEKALALQPDNGLARARLGTALLAAGRFAEASGAFERAATKMPLDAELLCHWAAACAIPGDAEPAIRHYREALSLNPDHAEAHFGLGYVLLSQEQLTEAIDHLTIAVQLEPTNTQAIVYLAQCYQKSGWLREAAGLLKFVASREPSGDALQRLEELQSLFKRRERARLADPVVSYRHSFDAMAERLARFEPKYLGNEEALRLRRSVKEPGLTAGEQIRLHAELANELLEIGQEKEAVEAIETAFSLVNLRRGTYPSPALHRLRGLAYVRLAEVTHCVEDHNEDSCILPLRGGGVHANPVPATRALESYEAFLAVRPDDLEVRWLLNVASMMLGRYPEGVPGDLLVPMRADPDPVITSRFHDIAPPLGVDAFDLCGGAVVADFDGDDRLDIVTSTYDPRKALHFYHNDGQGGFEERTEASRLDDQMGGLNINAADYDNDGDLDLFVMRGAWMYDAGKLRNSLLRNDGGGVFTDQTYSAGLAFPSFPTQASVWADFDNDGDLDLYVGNESRVEFEAGAVPFPSQLMVNDGKGWFDDRAGAAGVTNDRYAKGVAAGDYDNDGDMDLYVSNNGRNRLYRNDGDLSFTDVADVAGVAEPAGRSFATWFFDYDNDGWLDLFVGAFDASIADFTADMLGREFGCGVPRLYRNNGDGTFSDIARDAGLGHVYMPMGANFGDLDNDGYLDIYLSTGDPAFETLVPNVMLRNDGARRFHDVTVAGGFGHAQKGHGVAFADIDQDGDQDIFNQLGGFFPGDAFSNALYENPGHGNRFLVVRLVGAKSNRFGVGARVSVTVETEVGERTVHRAVGSVSSFGGSPLRQEIGLGNATAVSKLEVRWPVSGEVRTFTDVPLDSLVRVTEGREGLDVLPYEPVPFRPAPSTADEHEHHHHH